MSIIRVRFKNKILLVITELVVNRTQCASYTYTCFQKTEVGCPICSCPVTFSERYWGIKIFPVEKGSSNFYCFVGHVSDPSESMLLSHSTWEHVLSTKTLSTFWKVVTRVPTFLGWQNSLTFPWLFQSVQNSLTFPWLENAFPFFQVFQFFQSEWEPWSPNSR